MAKRKRTAALFDVITRSRSRTDPTRSQSPRSPAASQDESAGLAGPADHSHSDEPVHADLTLRLSRSAAFVCAVAMLTVVAGAFFAGKRMASRGTPLLTTTDQLRNQPAGRGILQVQPNPQANPDSVDPADPGQPRNTNSQQGQPAVNRKRIAGLNYVIIQSYPEKEREMAKAAVELLAQNGIDATIEQTIPGWRLPPGWCSVMGLTGFKGPLSTSPDFDAYMSKVRTISDGSGSKKNSFKSFEPQPFKWQK